LQRARSIGRAVGKAIESVVDGWRTVCHAYGIVKACDIWLLGVTMSFLMVRGIGEKGAVKEVYYFPPPPTLG
jgi:hypothetical protein